MVLVGVEPGQPGPHTHQTSQNLHQATFHMEEEIMILTNPFIETFQKSRKTRISSKMIFWQRHGWVGWVQATVNEHAW
jgi:hypothetical protein